MRFDLAFSLSLPLLPVCVRTKLSFIFYLSYFTNAFRLVALATSTLGYQILAQSNRDECAIFEDDEEKRGERERDDRSLLQVDTELARKTSTSARARTPDNNSSLLFLLFEHFSLFPCSRVKWVVCTQRRPRSRWEYSTKRQKPQSTS